jgi:hypothetical protein
MQSEDDHQEHPSPPFSEIEVTLEIVPGEQVQVTIDPVTIPGGVDVQRKTTSRKPVVGAHPTRFSLRKILDAAWLAKILLNTRLWLILATLIYLGVRILGLSSFPISFTSEEATASVTAADLLNNKFRYGGETLPPLFITGEPDVPGTSVYLQLLANLTIGQSVWGSRLILLLACLPGAIWLAVLARQFFQVSNSWMVILLLSLIPAWFITSRSAYPYAFQTSLYIGFWLYYLRYRSDHPRALYIALVLAALAFYTSPTGRILIVVTLVLLAILDFKRHVAQRWMGLVVLGMIILLFFPLVRSLTTHPADTGLILLGDSFWTQPLPFIDKLRMAAENYLAALNPIYWFLPNQPGFTVFSLHGYAFIPLILMPFSAWGLWMALNPRIHIFKSIPALTSPIRASANTRLVCSILLITPFCAGMLGHTLANGLPLVMLLVLLSALGLDQALSWLASRLHISIAGLSALLFVVLAIWNGLTLRDALRKTSTWNNDYGRDGLQYGAAQIFAETNSYLTTHADQHILITPSWTYHPDTLLRFFVPTDHLARYSINSFDPYLTAIQPDIAAQLFVLTAAEYQKVNASPLLNPPQVVSIIPYPNLQPGFYLVHLSYAPNAAALLQAEVNKLRSLVTDTYVVNGEAWQIKHSRLDMGTIKNIFDGDLQSLIRTAYSNPLVLEITFPSPFEFQGVVVRVGAEPVRLSATVTAPDDSQADFFIDSPRVKDFKDLELVFGQVQKVKSIRLEILDSEAGEPSNVHVWEVSWITNTQ